MAYANGRLPRSALAPITRAANGEQAYLRKDAARAFMAMNAESERRYGVTLRATSARSANRDIKDQEYFWAGSPNNPKRTWRGNLAAYPGTSNHGWGLAIDLATPQMRWIVDQIGAKYGWAKKWSDAPGEWWHLKWRPGKYAAVRRYKRKPRVIRKGSKPGKDIQKIQVLLRQSGYLRKNWKAHKKYTLTVRRAVRNFQRDQRMKVDGVVGPKTLNKLRAYARLQREKASR